MFDSLIKYLGLPGLFIALIIIIILNPEKINIWASWLNRHIFRRFFKFSQRKSVSLELQGKINAFKKSLNEKLPGILPYGMKIKWVHKENITRSAFLEKNQVVVVLKSYEEQDVNFVTAILLYLPKALIPFAKKNINEKSSRAIDLIYAKKIIKERKSISTLDYYINEVLYPELKNDSELENYCSIMDNLDNSGIPTSILMNELIILARKLNLLVPNRQIIYETRDFIIFLSKFSLKKRGEDVRLEFIRTHIRMGITPVAIKEKLKEFGIKPYKEAIERYIEQGIHRIYVVACGKENVEGARDIAKSFKDFKKVKKIKEVKYKRAFFEGKQTIANTIIISIK